MCACVCACMHACMCVHACVCACVHACVCVCMRVCGVSQVVHIRGWERETVKISPIPKIIQLHVLTNKLKGAI